MERFVKGEVVVLPFPFSDLSAMKKRPAVIVATLQGDDVICCQITSGARFDDYSIELDHDGFKEGGLQVDSMIRPNRIFTADKAIVSYQQRAAKRSDPNHKWWGLKSERFFNRRPLGYQKSRKISIHLQD